MILPPVLRRACLLAVLLAATASAAEPASEKPQQREFFEQKIRPLLVRHCDECHGSKKQESGLRLDTRDAWREGGDGGPVIIPGDPENSRLIAAVKQDDPDLKMPPGGKKLRPDEIADLEQWIRQGAIDPRLAAAGVSAARMGLKEAQQFWSFQPVKKPPLPVPRDKTWSWTPIDHFILRELEKRQLTPVPVADRQTLIRRATFDLTGLPPTPAEISRFLEDDSKDPFARLVDRLLETRAYGERWGRHWLDVARYADTAGDGADYPVREAIKYRDWVIRAFNSDQPFNDFIRDQIAGDIRAPEGPAEEFASRVTATGFLAIGKRYGYKPSPDYQHLDFADVIDSIGRSLLGLTLGCARCHDHKYDPVSAADYYALYGIMQSTIWAFPGGEEQKRPSHFARLVSPQEATRREAEKDTELATIDQQAQRLLDERTRIDPNWHAGGLDLGMEDQPIGKPLTAPWVCSGPIEVRTESQSPFTHAHPAGTRGVQIGSGLKTDGIRYVFKHQLKATPEKKMYFNLDFRTVAGSDQKGAYRFYLGQGVVQSLAIECSITADAFAIRDGGDWDVIRSLETGTWYTLQITIDPSSKTYSGIVGPKDDLTEFSNRKLPSGWNGIADCFICDAAGHVAGPACARDIDNLGLQESPFPLPGSKPLAPPAETEQDRSRIAEITRETERLTAHRKVIADRPPYDVAYGVSEGTPSDAKVQLRGEPSKPGEEIPRRFLEVLGGDLIPADSRGSGRRQLAEWLTRDSNPLTARVFVNRVWQWHFGEGIVDTPSDFGSRGNPPTHPELLDWITAEFIDSGWSVKHLHRRIMQSRTYQLDSIDQEDNLRQDPDNRWHWRYSRRRLDAESIRDAMLAVSGHLDPTIPGAHPFPPVESWGFTIHHPFYAVYDSSHRSVYLMIQRNRRHPYLALFDAADPNLSVGQRQPTITPTQALYLMNSSFVHQQASGFAKRLLAISVDDDSRIRLAFEMGHGRHPGDDEITRAMSFLEDYLQKLAGPGQPQPDHRLAAWSALARVILTSNAFLFVD